MCYIIFNVIRPRLPGAEGGKPGYMCGMAQIRSLPGSLLAAVVGGGEGVLGGPPAKERG